MKVRVGGGAPLGHCALRACYSLLTTRCLLLSTHYSLRYQVALVLTLQWMLYLLVTIGSYYKWWVESNQGPGVYSFSSTPTEDMEGPMIQLQQECTWFDQKMSAAASVPPSSPPANFSSLALPLLESASGELVEAEASNILNGAVLVRRDGCYPPHPRRAPTPRIPAPAPAPAPALAPQHRSTAAPQHPAVSMHSAPLGMPRMPRMPRIPTTAEHLTTERHVGRRVEQNITEQHREQHRGLRGRNRLHPSHPLSPAPHLAAPHTPTPDPDQAELMGYNTGHSRTLLDCMLLSLGAPPSLPPRPPYRPAPAPPPWPRRPGPAPTPLQTADR